MRSRLGFTLLELLLVLGLFGTLSLGAWRTFAPGEAQRAAREFMQHVSSQRLAALSGTTTAVQFDVDRQRFEFLRGEEGCLAEVYLGWKLARGVAVTQGLRDGVQWLPDGAGRSCSGGGVYGGRVRFEGPRETWDVILASTGRLRMERASP